MDKVDYQPSAWTTTLYYMNDDRAGDDSKPGLVAVDRDTGMMMATAVARKGVVDNTAQKLLARFIELCWATRRTC